ncbi:MAG: DUF3857 domain-containing protein [Flavobacteriales bacterium]|nr:DUF3857 domain-containing protein [Flavobacteriales bacterium]
MVTTRSLFPFLLMLTGITPALAQHPLLKDFDWGPAPVMTDEARALGDDVLLKRDVVTQFADEGELMGYYDLFHLQRYLHDVNAIEDNKTIHLNTGHIIEVIRIKARSIAPDGTVHELAPSAFITRADDRENQGGLDFAFEGLTPGSIIEYYMLTKERANYQGSSFRMQFGVPVLDQRYEVIVPDTWRFQFKTYNGLPMPQADSSMAGFIRHHVALHATPAIKDERSSFPDVHRMYLVQRLDAVPSVSALNISAFAPVTRNFHSNIYPELSSKTRKELAARIKEMGLAYARDADDRVRTIDQHIRLNFALADGGGTALSDLDQILKTRNCSEFGLQRLYANLFREAGIEHQLVLTTPRDESPFDPSFENHGFISDALFYFPELDKYLEPKRLDLGLGFPGAMHMGTQGLFIRNVELGGVFAGVGSVKSIPELPAEATRHDMVVDVSFNEDASESVVKTRTELTGYYAGYTQNFYTFMNEEQRTEVHHDHLAYLLDGAREQKVTVENGEGKVFGAKPLVFDATVTTPMLTSMAGPNVLFKVGTLIGPQMEMYADKDRKLPVDEAYARRYQRTLTVHLPNGMVCKDLSALRLNKELVVDGKVRAAFVSTAEEKDGAIQVVVSEHYADTHVPLAHFEEWRAVVNAAADFNKATIILTADN